MDYAKIVLGLPDETRDIINRTVQIFFVISKKNFVFIDAKDEVVLLTLEDKKCIALYLAGISIKSNISKTLLKSSFSKEDIFALFKMKIDDECLYEECLGLTKISDLFNKNFKEFIYRLRNASEFGIDKVSNVEFYSEIMYINLFSELITYSEVFPDIVKEGFIDNTNFIDELKNNFNEKLNHIQTVLLEPNTNTLKTSHSSTIIGSDEFIEVLCDDMMMNNYLSDPACGRDDEINKLIRILMSPEKSAIIIGEAGVGKTSIVEGLVYRIKLGRVPNVFGNKKIIKVNVSSLLSGCIYVGSFEERVENLISVLVNNPDYIVFIDEIHNVKGAGISGNKVMDLSNLLKPYLDRGLIKIIGATTVGEYDSYLSNDDAFKRRFETVEINDPNKHQLFDILSNTIVKLENIMGVHFAFDIYFTNYIINCLVEISLIKNKKINSISNPDFALDILKKIFVYAQFEDELNINVNHVVSALKDNEFIPELIINRYIAKIYNYNMVNVDTNNIIKFDDYTKKI